MLIVVIIGIARAKGSYFYYFTSWGVMLTCTTFFFLSFQSIRRLSKPNRLSAEPFPPDVDPLVDDGKLEVMANR